MKLEEIIDKLHMEIVVDGGTLATEVSNGYASDLMSDVIANAAENDLWVTLQTHQNTVAVASMKGIAAVVMVNSRQPEDDTRAKAEENDVTLLVSDLPAFELIGRLYEMGLRET
jgi:hypothetical protein